MKVAVIGLGYVGLVAAVGFAKEGHDVVGLDLENEKVKALSKGHIPFYEQSLEEQLRGTLNNGTLKFLHIDSIEQINSDVFIIAVGTPSLLNGSVDLTQVKSALNCIIKNVRYPVTIVMKSTVPPGTGRKFVELYLSGRSICHDYVSNPEFLREGQAVKDWYHPDRIVIGGDNSNALEKVKKLYENIQAPLLVSDITTAEMIKYAANAFLATKISFINEIANLCNHTGISIDGVIQGIALDPRIGPSFLQAGIGYGGSCFPKDVRALDYISNSSGYSFDLLKAVINVNNRQRLIPVQILKKELGNLQGKTIGILGMSFKPNTDDIREAPSLEIIRLIADEGARIQVYDPVVKEISSQYVLPEIMFAPDAYGALSGCEAVVLCTEWPEFLNLDWAKIRKGMSFPYLVIDGRNCLPSQKLKELCFLYYGIGRK